MGRFNGQSSFRAVLGQFESSFQFQFKSIAIAYGAFHWSEQFQSNFRSVQVDCHRLWKYFTGQSSLRAIPEWFMVLAETG